MRKRAPAPWSASRFRFRLRQLVRDLPGRGWPRLGEGAVAGATHEALEQVVKKATGFNVGGKIGIARSGEHLCVAIYLGVGVLNLNEIAVGLAHRSLPGEGESSM